MGRFRSNGAVLSSGRLVLRAPPPALDRGEDLAASQARGENAGVAPALLAPLYLGLEEFGGDRGEVDHWFTADSYATWAAGQVLDFDS